MLFATPSLDGEVGEMAAVIYIKDVNSIFSTSMIRIQYHGRLQFEPDIRGQSLYDRLTG